MRFTSPYDSCARDSYVPTHSPSNSAGRPANGTRTYSPPPPSRGCSNAARPPLQGAIASLPCVNYGDALQYAAGYGGRQYALTAPPMQRRAGAGLARHSSELPAARTAGKPRPRYAGSRAIPHSNVSWVKIGVSKGSALCMQYCREQTIMQSLVKPPVPASFITR